MAFYYWGVYLGKDSDEAAKALDEKECKWLLWEYLCKAFDHGELADYICDMLCRPIPYRTHVWLALEDLKKHPERDYYGVRWKDDEPSNNRRPKAPQCKCGGTPAKKASASKLKASGKKPANRAPARRY